MSSLGPLFRRSLLTALLMTSAATAEAAPEDYLFIGANASTLGPGLEMSAWMNKWFVLRVAGNFLEFVSKGNFDGISYKFDADIASAGAALDLHPFDNGFLISGGVYWNGNKADLESRSFSGAANIGGSAYTQTEAGTISGKVSYADVVPYIGIGYDNAHFVDGPWSITFRVGLFYMGESDVRLRSTGTLAGDPAFQADLEREARNIEDEFDVLSFYPAVTIGFKYRF